MRLSRFLPFCACFFSIAGFAQAQESERRVPARELLPPEYPPPSARGTLALAGAGVFAVWYGGALGASFLWPDADGASELRVPVAGPWLALGQMSCSGNCDTVSLVVRGVVTVIDGVGQIGGLAAVAEAAFLPTRSERAAERVTPRARVGATPFPLLVGKDGVGLGVLGAF